MPSSAPRQPAWAAATTRASGSLKRTGWQSAVSVAMARPGVVVTMASAVTWRRRRAVEGDGACGVGLVDADQPVGGHVERAGHAGPVHRHHRRLVGGAVAAVQPFENAGGRAAAPGEEAVPHLAEDGGGDDLEACGQGRHRGVAASYRIRARRNGSVNKARRRGGPVRVQGEHPKEVSHFARVRQPSVCGDVPIEGRAREVLRRGSAHGR
jgi:hypothetical protein